MFLARFLLWTKSIVPAPPAGPTWKVSTGCRGQPPASSPTAAQPMTRAAFVTPWTQAAFVISAGGPRDGPALFGYRSGMPKIAAILAILCLLALPATAAPPAAPGPAMNVAGSWQARIMGQSVTVRFTQNGNLISGLLVITDVSGQENAYHLSGTIVGDFFAAFHGSGHMLRGWLHGPDEATGELTIKDAAPVTFSMHRAP